MKARACLTIAALLLLACGAESGASLKLPAEVDGGWKLASAPGSATAAVYEGPARMSVQVQTLANQTAAFETVQKTRPAPDSIFFQEDRHFITVSSPGADNETLNRFSRALSAALRKKS